MQWESNVKGIKMERWWGVLKTNPWTNNVTFFLSFHFLFFPFQNSINYQLTRENLSFFYGYDWKTIISLITEAEFEPCINYGWFHLKLLLIFQDFNRRSIKTGFWRIWGASQIHFSNSNLVKRLLSSILVHIFQA